MSAIRLTSVGDNWVDTVGDSDSHAIGLGGDDTMIGFGGDDRLVGGVGDDLLIGGKGDDILAGGFGDDVLRGGHGNDKLLGNFGDNKLLGGDGDDILVAGSGSNVLVGGSGADKFVFTDKFGGHGDAKVTDFSVGEDSVVITSDTINSVDDLVISYDGVGNLVIGDGADFSVKFLGVTEADVDMYGADSLFIV